MQIKINEKILSIPPYISTSWSRIAALHMKGGILAITLIDGDTINIPKLSDETIEQIFSYHATYLEKEQLASQAGSAYTLKEENLKGMVEQFGEPSFKLAFGSLDGLNTAMQHNPAQANAPDLPPEILQKIEAISKVIAPSDEALLPKAEPFCNCFHCQVARVLNPPPITATVEEHHEEVSDSDLQFQQWTITQTGDKLFSVTNRLDTHEKYSVYLGHPVGCTCGKQGCEHILAVLKS
ncbi:hypothetical protein [Candidatus Protochlamydia phocaeensis]|uniref:hypothetical protein n=1 Tax=Candidatus Protochlamydia phocaeensis TaxID=1414722 RepID=UPI000A539166|nr:hypothetical protein [Candidatus Protochlamydia phocaeensis]